MGCQGNPYNLKLLWDLKGFSGGARDKESACQCRRHKRHRFDPWVRKMPWSRKWHPTLVSFIRKIPWTEEPGGLDMTENTHYGFETNGSTTEQYFTLVSGQESAICFCKGPDSKYFRFVGHAFCYNYPLCSREADIGNRCINE